VHASEMTGWLADEPSGGQARSSWPGSMMERVVGFIAADYQRPVGPVVIALVLTTGAALESGKSGGPFATDLALTLGLLGTAPIAVIRRFPTTAIGTVLAANATFVMFGRLSWSVAAVIGWLTALVAAPILLPRRRAAMTVALTEVAVLLGVAGLHGSSTPWDATAAEALAVLAAWGAGEMVRARRQATIERAEVAEQVRRLSAREVVAKERASIARELHDVVAHHVSMIAVRAATAPYSVPDLPQAGRAAFTEIAEEARTALTELRVVLGVLRSSDGTPEPAPQPRIGDLECLVERMGGAGMDVKMTSSGQVRQLPGSVELCCYRVIQEALTNASRHAHGSKVRVELGFGADAVTATVSNSPGLPARGPSPAEQAGFGLTGLRERVALLRGEFDAGPDRAGGFVVRAVVPVPVAEVDQVEVET
jgi:signal transduction histidine kinase